jgi:heptosyltransferase-2
LEQPRRVVVRGVNWLGDAVMSTPALQRLRRAFPAAHIALLAHEKLAGLWQGHPALNELLTFVQGESPWLIGSRLRAGNFDTGLVFPNSARSALELWFARIPQRVGHSGAGRKWLLTHVVAPRPERVGMHKRGCREIRALVRAAGTSKPSLATLGPEAHQSFDYLHLVAALGAPALAEAPFLAVRPEETMAAEQKLFAAGIHDEPGKTIWLGLNPSAAYGPAKRWPVENFAAVLKRLSDSIPNVTWLLFGEAKDREACERIAASSENRARNMAGQTSLRELMALLKLCRVLVTNDSGPMHLAAALGTPVVVPFGSTSPELTGPGLPGDTRHQVLRTAAACSPCFRRACPIDLRCMTSITVETVTAAVLKALGRPLGS